MRLSGWTVFSGVMLMLAGAFGVINGLIALINNEVYVVGDDRVVTFDFTQWGWIHLVLGGIVMLTGLAVAGSGATWARFLGVIVASVHLIAQVAFIEAYPFWTLATIGFDVLVIYGLLAMAEPEVFESTETARQPSAPATGRAQSMR
jgi:hypothetical protein